MHFNHLNAELNPICHLLALLGAHHIVHVSRIRVKIYLAAVWAISIQPYFCQRQAMCKVCICADLYSRLVWRRQEENYAELSSFNPEQQNWIETRSYYTLVEILYFRYLFRTTNIFTTSQYISVALLFLYNYSCFVKQWSYLLRAYIKKWRMILAFYKAQRLSCLKPSLTLKLITLSTDFIFALPTIPEINKKFATTQQIIILKHTQTHKRWVVLPCILVWNMK